MARKAPEEKPVARGAAGDEGARERLAEIKGVGPAKQDALIEHFGSLEAIRNASVEELTAVQGVGSTTAGNIRKALEQ